MADITSNLVAHWKLDETSGATAADSSGNGYNGTYVNSPTLNQAGAFGASKAVAFASANSHYVNCGNSLNRLPITLATWAKWTTSGSHATMLCNFIAGINDGYRIMAYNGLSIRANYYGSGGGQISATTPLSYNNGAWHHAVATVDNTQLCLYVDGSLKSTGTWTGSPGVTTTTQNVDIGRHSTTGWYFNGTLDDVRIYNRTLSAEDVAALYAYTGFLPSILDDCE